MLNLGNPFKKPKGQLVSHGLLETKSLIMRLSGTVWIFDKGPEQEVKAWKFQGANM